MPYYDSSLQDEYIRKYQEMRTKYHDILSIASHTGDAVLMEQVAELADELGLPRQAEQYRKLAAEWKAKSQKESAS